MNAYDPGNDDDDYYFHASNNDGESNEEVLSNDDPANYDEDLEDAPEGPSGNDGLLIDAADGYTFNLSNRGQGASTTRQKQDASAGGHSVKEGPENSANRFIATQQGYNSSLYEFSPEEISKMKEKVIFELGRGRRHKEGDCLRSSFIQSQLKNINFFPDPELNKLMSKLLRRLHYVKEAIRVTMYIFFDLELFKEYYVPSATGPSGISSHKPFPKYKRFHAFWLSIHCNESSFLAKYTKGLIDGNSTLRKHAVNGIEYTGFVRHHSSAKELQAGRTKVDQSGVGAKRKSKHHSDASFFPPSKRFKISVPSTQPESGTNEKKMDVIYDSNGFAYVNSISQGKRWYVRDPKKPPMTASEFYTPGRLLLMKVRAHYLWTQLKGKMLDPRELPWFSGTAMSSVKTRIQNLDYFSDDCLNQLVKQLLQTNITLVKAIKLTVSVFFSSVELSKAAVPISSTFHRALRPPINGYELFHEFWNYLFDIWNSRERKKRFEGSFGEVNRVYSTEGQEIPELPF